MAGSCEIPHLGEEFLDQLSNYQLLEDVLHEGTLSLEITAVGIRVSVNNSRITRTGSRNYNFIVQFFLHKDFFN